jgi:hypothetical protein
MIPVPLQPAICASSHLFPSPLPVRSLKTSGLIVIGHTHAADRILQHAIAAVADGIGRGEGWVGTTVELNPI